MKKMFIPLVTGAALFASSFANAQDGELTGDTRLACEAILCLSSGTRPGECAPSIRKYFSIHDKKPHKMIQKRKDFLNMCPASNEPNMPSLVNAIANGAGRCNAADLNRYGQYTYEVWEGAWRDRRKVRKTAYRNTKPSYCTAYFQHEWTVLSDTVRYVGEEKNGGKWVDVVH
jgi:hypothetical protein